MNLRTSRATLWLTLLVLSAGALCSLGLAANPANVSSAERQTSGEEDLAIIVNRANPVDTLTFAELKKIFLQERAHWSNGRKITVVMRDPGQPERQTVLRVIYQMSEKDLNRYFLQAIFTGEVQSAPKQLSTPEGVRRFVFNVPGAIGYVRASEVDDTVKVLRVDGRLPGSPEYAIRAAGR